MRFQGSHKFLVRRVGKISVPVPLAQKREEKAMGIPLAEILNTYVGPPLKTMHFIDLVRQSAECHFDLSDILRAGIIPESEQNYMP
jgi:hypothetical protein